MTTVMYGTGISAPLSPNPWDQPKPLEPLRPLPAMPLVPTVTLTIDPISFSVTMERMAKALEDMTKELKEVRKERAQNKMSGAQRRAIEHNRKNEYDHRPIVSQNLKKKIKKKEVKPSCLHTWKWYCTSHNDSVYECTKCGAHESR